MATQTPAPRMDVFTARRWCRQGYAIRRAVWHGGVTLQTPAPTPEQIAAAHPLAWITYARGLYTYTAHASDGSVTACRIVQAGDVLMVDYNAADWTTEAPIADNNDILNPPAPNGTGGGGSTGGSGSGGSGTGGSGSGGSGSGGSGSGGSGSGGSGSGGSGSGGSGSGGSGSGGGGGGGGNDPKRKPKSPRNPPNLSVDVSRSSGDACIPRLSNGGGGSTPNDEPITDSFTGTVTLDSDPDAKDGELWFLTVTQGSPDGAKTIFHGTIKAGDNTDISFSITAKPGESFNVQGAAHLSHVALDAQGNASAEMRPGCDPVMGCKDITATNYNSAATDDDGSCTYPPPPPYYGKDNPPTGGVY